MKLRDSQFGPVIFNGRDQAAYFFTRDSGGASRCYWFAVTAAGKSPA